MQRMSDTEKKFYKNITRKNLISKSDKVLAALSGGSDSVFLLKMLTSVREKMNLTVEAFHLNHGLREEAADEALFAAELCRAENVVFHTACEDTAAYAKAHSVSAEQAGRDLRYSHLKRIAEENSFQKIATAHHFDDNAETVLMRIIRGTSVKGLGGIAEMRGSIIRPLLIFTKDEIISYLNEKGTDYVTDQSNFDRQYFRNRVRHDIMPALEKENVRIKESLMRLSQTARLYDDFITAEAEKTDIKTDGESAEVLIADIRGLHEAVLAKVLVLMAESAGAEKDLSFSHISRVSELIRSENTVWSYDAAAAYFSGSYEKLTLKKTRPECEFEAYNYPVYADCVHYFAKERLIVRLKCSKKTKKNTYNAFLKQADYDKIGTILSVRSRQQGDFFYPLGLGGKKTIKTFFIDKKVPAAERDAVPLLTDGQNIICAGDLQIDERYKITDKTENILNIQFERMI